MDRINSETCPLNKKLSSLPELTEAWWNRWHLAADDWGVFIAEPAWLRGKLWPYRKSMTDQKIIDMIAHYERLGLVFTWKVSAQCTHSVHTVYGYFTGWFEHNPIRYLSKRKFPAPPPEYFEFKIINADNNERIGSKNIQVISHLSAQCAYNERTPTASTETDIDTGIETETETYYLRPAKNAGALFSQFWKKYPARNGKKSGKALALIEWNKLKITQELFNKIIISLNAQIKHKNTCDLKREFCAEFPDACRWLKRKEWEAEISSKKNTQEQTPEEKAAITAMVEKEMAEIGNPYENKKSDK